MKNNQFGFVGPAVMMAAAALGTVSLIVKQQQNAVNQEIELAERVRDQEQIRIAAINTASRYKALLAEKKIGPGTFAPALYAEDYFAYNWKLKKNDQIKDQLNFGLENGVVTMDSNGSLEQSMDRAVRIFSQEKSLKSQLNENYSMRIVDTHRKTEGVGAGLIVESVDVEITQSFKSDLGKQGEKIRVRIPVATPKPYNGKIYFRKAGTGSDFEELKSGGQLSDGKYEFKASASGIMTGAKLFIDGTEHKLGYHDFNDIYHSLRNYNAKDVKFPDTPSADFFSDAKFKVVQADWDPAHTDCRISLDDKSHQVHLELIGVDGEVVKYDPIVMNTKSGQDNLSLSDYQNKCVAPGQCPYVGDSTDEFGNPTGDAVGQYWEAHGFGKIDDVSSLWNFEEAKRFGLTDRKLCMRLDPNKVSPTETDYMTKSDMMTYQLDTCQPRFLHQRAECGCVAEDTLITLGDGKTQKRIDQLDQSDKIWNPITKKAMAMRKMTRGPEKIPMLKISVGDKELSVTGNHPFPTRSGMKTAFSLVDGEEIMLDGGQWLKIAKIDPVKKGDKAPVVWNIELEAPNQDWDAHHYVANGVVTGDLLIQTQLESARKTAANN